MTALNGAWPRRAEAPSATHSCQVAEVDPHPGTGAAPADIVAHLLATHHRTICERLQRIGTFVGPLALRAACADWRGIARHFADLREAMLFCLRQERCFIFPHAAMPASGDLVQLRDTIAAIERIHARLVKQLWALREQVAQAPAASTLKASLAMQFAELLDDFYQHLFEEECLLFPQLTAACARPETCGAGTHAVEKVAH